MRTIIDNGTAVTNLNLLANGGGTEGDYEKLKNLPKIEGETLIGDKALPDIGVVSATEEDIDNLFDE